MVDFSETEPACWNEVLVRALFETTISIILFSEECACPLGTGVDAF